MYKYEQCCNRNHNPQAPSHHLEGHRALSLCCAGTVGVQSFQMIFSAPQRTQPAALMVLLSLVDPADTGGAVPAIQGSSSFVSMATTGMLHSLCVPGTCKAFAKPVELGAVCPHALREALACSSSSQLGKVCGRTQPLPSLCSVPGPRWPADLLEEIILHGSHAKFCQSNLKSI